MIAAFVVRLICRLHFLRDLTDDGYQGAIGVLDRQDMDHFAEIFVNYQKRGKTRDKASMHPNPQLLHACSEFMALWSVIADLDAKLSPWTAPGSPGKKRADSDDHSFSVKFVLLTFLEQLWHLTDAVGLCVSLTQWDP